MWPVQLVMAVRAEMKLSRLSFHEPYLFNLHVCFTVWSPGLVDEAGILKVGMAIFPFPMGRLTVLVPLVWSGDKRN